MDTIIKEITENDFINSKDPLLFKSDGLNRTFGLISNKNVHYIIGWQSVVVKPKVVELTLCNTAIGIDLNFAIINFCQDQVLVNMELTFYFIDIVKAGRKLLLITELEVFELEMGSYNIINTYSLPDIFEEITVSEKIISLRCMDGRAIELDFNSLEG